MILKAPNKNNLVCGFQTNKENIHQEYSSKIQFGMPIFLYVGNKIKLDVSKS